jgi:hypothetical protein
VPGNHEIKLMRALQGKNIKVTHGLAESLEQIAQRPPEFRKEVVEFIDSLISHYVLDDGKLVVAHAGMKLEMQGRGSGRVREFALYGETTGETDDFGLPVRYNWAADYRGRALVVYGHTPTVEPEWVNGTICIDSGCVFGGKLTALRYPEKELVSVPAARMYYEPSKPMAQTIGEAHVSIGDVVVRARSPAAYTHLPAGSALSTQHAHHRNEPAPERDHPRGERHGGARSDEPFRRESEVAGVPAADDVAVRHDEARRAARTSGRGIRVLPRRRRAEGRVRRKAHGVTSSGRDLSG